MKISPDELEYLISQYLDGTLNPLERNIVEEQLATNPDAREILRSYESLNSNLKSAMPLPEIAWDNFAASIQAKTAQLDLPVRHFKLTFATISKFASVAAMILIAVGLFTKFRGGPAGSPPGEFPGSHAGSAVAVAEINLSPVMVHVNGPAPASAAIAKVTIGSAPDYADADFHSADAIISQPQSIWIASGSPAQQDTEASPYQ